MCPATCRWPPRNSCAPFRASCRRSAFRRRHDRRGGVGRRRSALLFLERLEQRLAGLSGFGLVGSVLELADRGARRRTDRAAGGAAIEAEIAQEDLDGLGLARAVGRPGLEVGFARGLVWL